jgi:hypothetical protein
MDLPSPAKTAVGVPLKVGNHWAWLLPLLGLLAWHGWLTLGLFDADHGMTRLLDDQPVMSGRHPLHLYHGSLGATSLRQHGTASCYDPAFNAGYPKTPVFDSGSRPAEITLLLAGGGYNAPAYKIGLAVICAAVSVLLVLGARGIGLSWAGTDLATALGMLVWWGQPCHDALEAGHVDLLLATALVVAQAGMLIRYHRTPGPLSLVGVLAMGFLGWFADPVLMALLLPLFLIYYLSVGARHSLLWHVGLIGGLFLALALNAFWLLDYLEYWWILLPPHLNVPPLGDGTFPNLWDAPIWGGPLDRVLICTLLPAAVMGLVIYNQTRQRAAARFLGLGMFGFLAVAVLSLVWEPLGRFGMARLLVPGLFFAVLPAAHVVMATLEWVRRRTRWWVVPVLVGAFAIVCWFTVPADSRTDWLRPWTHPQPLAIGLTAEQRATVETLRANTTPQGRVLWEDMPASIRSSRWSALLPLLTERPFVGGLDPDGVIEHTATGLADHSLAGRSLNEWTDAELQTYCDRYNIGWVVCWSPETMKRFTDPQLAERVDSFQEDGQQGTLLRVNRQPTFVLSGSAQWLRADAECISLGDVIPKDGQVLLSLHYQEGLRVTPSRVTLQRAETLNDRIDFVRLVIPDNKVARVTITWEKR